MKMALQIAAGLAIALALYHFGYYAERAIREQAFRWCQPPEVEYAWPELPAKPGLKATDGDQLFYASEYLEWQRKMDEGHKLWHAHINEIKRCHDSWITEGRWLFKR